MPMSFRKTAFLLVVMAAAGSVLAGCGRRNDPMTPYEAAVERREEARKAGTKPLPPVPEPPQQDRRFILDGLID